MADDRWVVFGLGNPGDLYAKTRHNIGQMVIDYLAINSKYSKHKSKCEIADIRIAGCAVTLGKSTGFMNDSGLPAKALADFYKVDVNHLIIIHDELDIAFNTIRLKQGGGDNGHNGLKSLTTHFVSPDYFRVRMGIGRPSGPQDPADYVLKPFDSNEKKELSDFTARGAQAVEELIDKGLETAQQNFNS